VKLVDRFIRFFTAGITRHKKLAALLQDIFFSSCTLQGNATRKQAYIFLAAVLLLFLSCYLIHEHQKPAKKFHCT